MEVRANRRLLERNQELLKELRDVMAGKGAAASAAAGMELETVLVPAVFPSLL